MSRTVPQEDRYATIRYRPLSRRRRLLIVLLALATVLALLGYMLDRRGQIVRAAALAPVATRADVAVCRDGRTANCVGGTAAVIMVAPPPAAASRP